MCSELRKTLSICISLLFVLLSTTAHAWPGKCVAITDGDTIKAMQLGAGSGEVDLGPEGIAGTGETPPFFV